MKTTLRWILKSTPAVVLVLLMVAWVVSWYSTAVLSLRSGRWYSGVGQEKGTVILDIITVRDGGAFEGWMFIPAQQPPVFIDMAGRFFSRKEHPIIESLISGGVPHVCIVTAILPLAIGALTGFRFRLWHYLAYTALVGVELAYYSRWQE
jgi:hypothetical protein